MPNKTSFVSNSAWPSPIPATNPLVFPAVGEKTYPNSWVKKCLFDVGIDLDSSMIKFELLPYNENEDEIFSAVASETIEGPFTKDTILDLPEAKTFFKAAFNIIAPLRLWLRPSIDVVSSKDEEYAPIAGKYFRYGTGIGKNAVYYKIGSSRRAKISYSSESESWQILYDNEPVWYNLQDEENLTPDNPWQVLDPYWEAAESDPFLTVTEITY